MDNVLSSFIRILVVDDDEVDRMTIKRSLRKANINAEVEIADTAQAGFELIKQLEFDCIFIDYLLPDKNGLELLRQIREQGYNTPVLIVTSQGDEGIAAQALRSGASDYISKNMLSPEGISHSVRNAIRVYQVQKERQAAELALRLSEARLKEAQRLARIGSWEMNLVSREVKWSEQMYEITELDPAESPLSLEQFAGLVHPEDQEMRNKAVLDAIAFSSTYQIDYRLITAKGKLKHIYANGSPISDEAGKLISFIGTVQDITERINTRNALEESEERYRTLIETMNEGVVYVNNEEIIQFANKRYCEMLGYEREELIGKSTVVLLSDQNSQKIIKRQSKLRKKNIAGQYEISLRKKNGDTLWVLIGGSPIYDNNGLLIGSMGTHTDITQRKKTEEALANREKIFRTLFQNVQSFICTHKLNGQIISMNKAGLSILGLPERKVTGKNLKNFFEKKKKSLFDHYLQEIISKGTGTGIFKVKNNVTGSYHYLLYQSIIFEEPGSEPYIIGTAQDITDRIVAEKELLKAKEIAEKSVKVKEQFLANMSHEIRTPLNGIIGLANVLVKMVTDQEKASYVQAIQSSADKLLIIINDILDFSKIESGKIEVEHVDFNIKHLLKETFDLFKVKAIERNNKLDYFINSTIPDVINGDPGKLAQVLNNMVGNAIKFTQNGQIKVTVENIVFQEEVHWLEFTVQDNGIGIPEEKQGKVFESFTQASSDTNRKYGGTGLGLTICKHLIELQGGTLHLESQVNQGSSFRFSLPFRDAVGSTTLKDHQTEINPFDLGPLRVLVAEDNEVNQILMRKILNTWDFQFDIAENGVMAVEKLNEKEFDIVLMDMQMPEMDGYEAMAYIRKLKSPKSQVPIIALTAHASKEEAAKCLQAGADAYISKPFKNNELLTQIGLLVKKDKSLTVPDSQETLSGPASDEIAPGLVNLDNLRELSDGDPEFMNELISLYISQTPEFVNQLSACFQQTDMVGLSGLAHKMKSSAGLMGIFPLLELLAKLESYGNKKAPLSEIEEIIKQVAKLSEFAIKELENIKTKVY